MIKGSVYQVHRIMLSVYVDKGSKNMKQTPVIMQRETHTNAQLWPEISVPSPSE